MMDEVIQHQGQWYVLVGSSRADERTRVLKDGDGFAMFDRFGDIQNLGAGALGLYHGGTRFLSRYELTVNGTRPHLLNSEVREDNTLLTVDLNVPQSQQTGEAPIPEGTVHVFRSKLLSDGVQHEHVRITNYGSEPAELSLRLAFAADYADIFEVRGVKRKRRGTLRNAHADADSVELSYNGIDGLTRRTRLHFAPSPDTLSESSADYCLHLAPHSKIELFVDVSCEQGTRRVLPGYVDALDKRTLCYRDAQTAAARVVSSNEQFNQWLNRSSADLHMLITETPHGRYPYAGVPWFSTAFGRDGIITAMQTLWADPSLAGGVLTFLAATQANESDPSREAQPGKILHECRDGEMAALDEHPFRRYYGTVDATPLFAMLAGAYLERTGDKALLERLWPNVRAALEWLDTYGDADGDGFVEYQRRGDRGLVNQGWKDSEDSVFHADGSDAPGPIALCEVQAYAFEARCAGARIAQALGDDAYAKQLARSAERLRARIEAQFWDETLQTYVIAIDGNKRPCRVRTSNAGHVLFAGAAAPARALRTARTLLSSDSFSGWGIRTLSSEEARYNPMSYHNGSVWPHDNALIAQGFARYGLKSEALQLFGAMYRASTAFDLHRLPELFCGFDALPGQGPIRYPVACSPQAWASGTVFILLQAVLGMRFHAEKPQLRFHHPQLPEWIQWLEINDLRVGDGAVDLMFQRHRRDVSINITRKEGDVEVVAYM